MTSVQSCRPARRQVGGGMLRVVAGRCVQAVIVALVVGVVGFAMMEALPGDAAFRIAAGRYGYDTVSAAAAEQVRAELGLDRPIVVQYFTFVVNAAQGDLGPSLFFRQPVTQVLAARAEPTIFLALFSLVFALVIATPIGIYAAYRRGSFLDQSAISTAMLAASIPSFWTGLMFQRYLATDLGLFPASGYGGPDASFIERISVGVS